ncbi:MAG TPA: ATP-dependent sacrificial sulfur transferase LarE [Bacteroidales bacterium]|nr:ATP-dependent sacrificial sulfur transferase LarE [Bacteroidales bacterium]
MQINDKVKLICSSFDATDNILVAFSGGVDSSFLLYILYLYSSAKVSAITVKTPYIPGWEIDEAINFAESLKIEHKIIELPIDDSIIRNPEDRCYRCKSILFGQIKKYAYAKGFNLIADGSNADDKNDYRPGMKALKELEIRSPLLEAGFSKQEIRNQLKEFGLDIWDKPAYSCLLTRIPYNTLIDKNDLNLIEESEMFLHNLGFRDVRVRFHNDLIRLEINPEYFNKIMKDQVRKKIIRLFKDRNIKYISLDLEGYRTGSMHTKT